MANLPLEPTDGPEPYIVQSRDEHTHTAILLHGLGSNGEKFGTELLGSSGLADSLPGTKFIFPTARRSRSAAFKRAVINQWFNLASLEDPLKHSHLQIDGLADSAGYVRSIMDQETKVIPPRNVLLGGLSQGCATAIFTLLGLEFSVGAFVGMSGWLPLEKDLGEIIRLGEGEDDGTEANLVTFGDEDENSHDTFLQAVRLVRDEIDASNVTRDRTCLGTPIFLGHGGEDEKIKCRFGEGAAKVLASLGLDVVWRLYPDLGHWYGIPDEIDDILAFLRETSVLSDR